jgi:hypothetical protein
MLLTACTYARGRTVLRYSDGRSEPGSGICFCAALLQHLYATKDIRVTNTTTGILGLSRNKVLGYKLPEQ